MRKRVDVPVINEAVGPDEAGMLMGHAAAAVVAEAMRLERQRMNVETDPRDVNRRFWESMAPAARAEAPVAMPTAAAIAEPAQPDGLDAEYVELARKLGIRSAATLEPELLRILHEEMIPVYDYGKVTQYLNYLAKEKQREIGEAEGRIFPMRVSWAWYCLRAGENEWVRAHNLDEDVYPAAIPMPVLLTIDKIQSQLPEARFFVSQIEEVADPFLAVTVPGSTKLYVIERWDEPGFRG